MSITTYVKKFISFVLPLGILFATGLFFASNIGLTLTVHLFWGFLWLISKLSNIIVPSALLFLSICVILFSNPIYSLVSLILVFFNMFLVLLSIKIEFLAMIFLIIYIGAISILFLFVIMMFNLKDLHSIKKPVNFYYSIYWFGLLFVSKFYLTISTYFNLCISHSTYFNGMQSAFSYDIVNIIRLSQDIFIIGNNLYTNLGILFILLGFVLLAAMVGAIILALLTNLHYKEPHWKN